MQHAHRSQQRALAAKCSFRRRQLVEVGTAWQGGQQTASCGHEGSEQRDAQLAGGLRLLRHDTRAVQRVASDGQLERQEVEQ